jgi:pantetheine-phosphate adenylyltransferase
VRDDGGQCQEQQIPSEINVVQHLSTLYGSPTLVNGKKRVYYGPMLRVIMPGSFDPPTNGHLNLVERVQAVYDEVYIVVAHNSQKQYTFESHERVEMMEALTKQWSNVSVHLWERLIVEFAQKVNARIMVRGVRALSDFSYEFELSMLNKGLDPEIETIFMPTDARYFVLRSSAIKELVRLGGDVSTMVPEMVEKRLRERIAG